MAKTIDFSKTVYELSKDIPEFIDIMASLGFSEIRKRPILLSAGKLMTVPKGAKMKHIDMKTIAEAFIAKGYTVEGLDNESSGDDHHSATSNLSHDARIATLKGYLQRLSGGEALDSVRDDFVRNFADVEAAEIMRAEQELIAEGEPVGEVKKLCDVHSALFHGKTRQERIANTEREVAASVSRQQLFLSPDAKRHHDAESERQWVKQVGSSDDRFDDLIAIEGHPLQTFVSENDAIGRRIDEAQRKLAEGSDIGEDISRLRGLAIHYAKKGDLLYPMLNVRYGIFGPSKVMWTVDDEIRAELSSLSRTSTHDDEWNRRAAAVMKRADEMIFKENNILLHLCAANFTDAEWQQIYRDSLDYEPCLGVDPGRYQAALASEPKPITDSERITLGGGSLSIDELEALLNTIPLEITFVDANNINRFFNDNGHPKAFKRPLSALGREVFTCHPPKVEPMVRAIIDSFRSGKRDEVPVWMEKNGRATLVRYMAVRSKQGKYLGTMEIVQDMQAAKEHFTKKEE